jgi:hypothetical protein
MVYNVLLARIAGFHIVDDRLQALLKMPPRAHTADWEQQLQTTRDAHDATLAAFVRDFPEHVERLGRPRRQGRPPLEG